MFILQYYLVSSTISNHHKQGPVLQGDSILYLDTNSVVYLLSDCCHCPTAAKNKTLIQNYVKRLYKLPVGHKCGSKRTYFCQTSSKKQ